MIRSRTSMLRKQTSVIETVYLTQSVARFEG